LGAVLLTSLAGKELDPVVERKHLTAKMPPLIGPVVYSMLQSHLKKQLYARGAPRHTPEVIEAKGRGDVDALADFLGDRPFLLADQATVADTAVFGLLAPMVDWPMETPVASYAKSVRTIVSYCDRMRQRCFEREDAAA
jgi:glutathione S-transferase